MALISTLRTISDGYGDSASIDAFGRLRVAEPYTIFDSKNIYDDPDLASSVENQPLFYDNQETSGGGTSTTYNAAHSSTTIAVSATTAGTRVRQTRRRFNYQPGKSQLIMNTFVIGSVTSGITKREGNFDANNGIFLECSDAYYIVRRTSTSGSPVDNKVAQSAWNIDSMDGTGPSGVTLDFTKTQIFFMDWEWLGVGRVRCGFVIDGLIFYAHEFLNTNVLDVVYMQTPNLPIRTEITNDGTGAADSITQICSTVISEGGVQEIGFTRGYTTDGTVTLGTSGNFYPVVAMRLKSAYLGLTTITETISLYSSSASVAEFKVLFNPTYSSTLTWTDQAQSGVQIAKGDGTITASGGYMLGGDFISGRTAYSSDQTSSLRIGSAIDGTPDTVALVVKAPTNNYPISAIARWKELL